MKLNAIKCKDIKDGEETLSRYVVHFEVIVDDFDRAVELAKDLESNLANNLKGQTVLKK